MTGLPAPRLRQPVRQRCEEAARGRRCRKAGMWQREAVGAGKYSRLKLEEKALESCSIAVALVTEGPYPDSNRGVSHRGTEWARADRASPGRDRAYFAGPQTGGSGASAIRIT